MRNWCYSAINKEGAKKKGRGGNIGRERNVRRPLPKRSSRRAKKKQISNEFEPKSGGRTGKEGAKTLSKRSKLEQDEKNFGRNSL